MLVSFGSGRDRGHRPLSSLTRIVGHLAGWAQERVGLGVQGEAVFCFSFSSSHVWQRSAQRLGEGARALIGAPHLPGTPRLGGGL